MADSIVHPPKERLQPATRIRSTVFSSPMKPPVLLAAILADEVVPEEQVESRKGDLVRPPHVFAQRDQRGLVGMRRTDRQHEDG
jgi:hypothetical protein